MPRPADPVRAARLTPGAVLALLAFALPVAAQTGAPQVPPALRNAPPEIDQSRPGGDPASPGDRSGGGPTGNDVLGDDEGGGPGRSVIRPPMSVDPGIRQGTVPDPAPPVARPVEPRRAP